MIYIIGMPTKLVPGTSLFVTIFITAIVTILHAFNYHSIDLILVMTLIFGSILGVQVGQKMGQYLDGSQLKTLLALLLLIVGIAMAYNTFIKNGESTFSGVQYIKSEIGTFSKFILDLSNDFPIAYGLLSIILAITLGVIGSFIRKMLSDNKTKLKQLAGL